MAALGIQHAVLVSTAGEGFLHFTQPRSFLPICQVSPARDLGHPITLLGRKTKTKLTFFFPL